jgi:hypothetical protein
MRPLVPAALDHAIHHGAARVRRSSQYTGFTDAGKQNQVPIPRNPILERYTRFKTGLLDRYLRPQASD